MVEDAEYLEAQLSLELLAKGNRLVDPPCVMSIRLPDQESCRLLTPFEPRVWLSFATSDREDWEKSESTIG